jgi:hypothetical protein
MKEKLGFNDLKFDPEKVETRIFQGKNYKRIDNFVQSVPNYKRQHNLKDSVREKSSARKIDNFKESPREDNFMTKIDRPSSFVTFEQNRK